MRNLDHEHRVAVAVGDGREHLLDERSGGALAVAMAVVTHARDERSAGAHLHDDQDLL